MQWTTSVPQSGTLYWYHFASSDLVSWECVGVDPVWNVSGCSGGAIVVPSEVEEGATATPVDRTGDPQLAQWAQVDLTSEGYFPPEIPGKWNCSAAREVGPLSGEVRFRVSHGCLAG